MKVILVALALVALLVACGDAQNQQNTTGTPTGNVVTDEGAIADDAEIEGERENTADRTPTQEAAPTCADPVEYQTLVGALPQELQGFSPQGEPEGTTLSWTDPENPDSTVRYSTASTTLTGSDGTVVVSLLDTCYTQNLAQGWSQLVEYEGSDGFMRKVTVEDYPGWVRYDKSTDTYTLNLLIEDRVFVTVQGSQGVSQEDLEAAAGAIDYDAIEGAM